MGFILMYDVTNEESFNAVQDWLVYLDLRRKDKRMLSLLVIIKSMRPLLYR
jgi:GTPase SAR1 family protein